MDAPVHPRQAMAAFAPTVHDTPERVLLREQVARFVAREVVKNGYAKRAEVQVAYAIGRAEPVSVRVDTFGTGDARAAEEFIRTFDYRPAAMIERLRLRRPIYRQTTNYGHFGKPSLSWEA